MKLITDNKHYTIYNGSMLDMLEVIKSNSIDSIVCDPPYHLQSIVARFGKENSAEAQYGNDGAFKRLSKGFMGKEWDGGDIAFQPSTWKKCYEVLKPGGYLLAFGGSRTFHRIAVAIEDAGFEIRDTIMYLYGSGFPKSMNIGLTIDKKNGVYNRTGNFNRGAGSNKTTVLNTGLNQEYEERKAQNKNKYLQLIEEELKKQGVENIEWK
jgi:DNA modification methylase